jgi:hypothetical protein
MTDRELCASIRDRFTALRTAVRKRHIELIAEMEADLLSRYRCENELFDELNRRLSEITDEANRKVVALLREHEDLAESGRWKGSRQAMFEAPRICRVTVQRTRQYRRLIADIDKQAERALQLLDRQQASLLRRPDRARTLMAKGAPAIVTGLIPPTRLWEVPLDSTALV